MAWAGIVASSKNGRGLTVAGFRTHVANLTFKAWRPSFMVLHNTGAPTLAQWKAYPAAKRILNLERYYRDQQGWSSAPHAFVADDLIWPFTPFIVKGTHSPSFNGTAIGIELVGDYEREEPQEGDGLKVYKNAVAVFAILHEKLGLDPGTIKFHRDDPRTTHACPGSKLYSLKSKFIQDVREYMGVAGEHPLDEDVLDPPPLPQRPIEAVVAVPDGDTLNLRDAGAMTGKVIVALPKGQRVAVLSRAMNGGTEWARVWLRMGGQERVGWVAARFLQAD